MLSRPFAVGCAWTFTNIWLVPLAWPLAAEIAAWLVTRLQHLLSVATPIVELAVTDVGIGELVLDLLIVVTHAAPVLWVVLPVLDAHVVPIHVPVEVKILIDIDIYIAVSPIDVIPNGITNCIGCAPSDPSRERATEDVTGGGREVIRLVVLVGPRTVNDGWFVIGNIDAFR